ncbi:hypothetical protein Gasu2_64630 [Galdieria sulphuraria]|nr:hypothetical protein Gasu2_64630 [Galdieria sulphuraria]
MAFTFSAHVSRNCWTLVAKGGDSKDSSKAKSSRIPKRSKKSTRKSLSSGDFVDNWNSSKHPMEELTSPISSGLGSHRRGVGLNDIPVDLGEVFSDPLLEEKELTELPADESSWKHAVEYALEEIHSQVKYSKSQFSWMKPFTNKSKNTLLCERCEDLVQEIIFE